MSNVAYRCPECNNQIEAHARFCPVCGLDLNSYAPPYQQIPQPPAFTQYQSQPVQVAQAMSGDNTLRRLHDYEKLSGVFWIGLGVVQIMSICVLFVFGIPVAIVGLWNIFAGISRLRVAPRILAGDASIPSQFSPMAGLIIIGLLNLTLGGIIGVLMVIFDFIIRDQILSNQHLFQQRPASV